MLLPVLCPPLGPLGITGSVEHYSTDLSSCVSTDVPPPRLVGIELNPGPGGPSASSSSSGMSARPRARKSRKRPLPLLLGEYSACFSPASSYPNMMRHVPLNQSVRVQGSYEASVLTSTSTTVPTQTALYFNAAAVGSSADLSGAFDQYRIVLAEVWIIPSISENTGLTNPGQYVTAVDLDDASNPTSVLTLSSYADAQVSSTLAAHYHRFVPHLAVAAYTGTFSGFANEAEVWIDAANLNVQHYGLKFAASTTPIGIIPFQYVVRLTIDWRGLHN